METYYTINNPQTAGSATHVKPAEDNSREFSAVCFYKQIFLYMTITREKKKEIVKQLQENLKKQNGVFFIDFKGLKGESSHYLRSELNKGNANMFIARKTLAKIAFEKEGIDFDPQSLEGEVGFVFSFENGINTAKILHKFVKDKAINLHGGLLEGSLLTAQEVDELAKLPSREELMAKLLGTMSAPMGNFLHVLQGNIKGLLYVLANKEQ